MTPEAALLLVLALVGRPPARALPAQAERPPAEVYYGAELPSPFLPVLPPAATWDVPADLKDAATGMSPTAPPASGWINAASSLLLLTPTGGLVHELGLGRFTEEEGTARREMLGGASADGRFAWHWQRVERRPDARVLSPEEAIDILFTGAQPCSHQENERTVD